MPTISRGTVPQRLAELTVDQSVANATYSVVKATSTQVFAVSVDNTRNTHATYLRLYNHATPTVGTTIPAILLKVQASSTFTMFWPVAPTLGNACTFVCVQGPGTSGAVAPTNNVRVIVLAT